MAALVDESTDASASPAPTGRVDRLARQWIKLTLISTLVVLIAAIVPTPYTLKAPGRASDVSAMVKVAGGRHDFSGKLLMTTVIYEKANLFFCLYAALDPDARLVSEPAQVRVVRDGPRPLISNQMEDSKLLAGVAAFQYMGYKVKLKSAGMRIMGFMPNVPSSQTLEVGDIIRQVNGRDIRQIEDLRQALDRSRPYEEVAVQVRRSNREVSVKARLIESEGRTMLGVTVRPAYVDVDFPKPYDIDTGNVRGASAGLMFALEVVRQVRNEDLAPGWTVAGTGTISPDGTVGPIEGVEHKVVAAARAGAEVFLVPVGNMKELQPNPTHLRLIPVKSLAQAVRALQELPPK